MPAISRLVVAALFLVALLLTRADADAPITHVTTKQKIICLTFDACATPSSRAGFDNGIVSELESTHTPATFMLTGLWMDAHASETRRLASNPLFELGSHSWSHPHMCSMTTDQIVLELQRTQRELFLLTGRQGTLFRPPYIEYNDRLVATAKSIGLTTITCSVISGDPDRHIGADRMTRAVLDQAKPGAFIIMHVNGRGWHTAEALPAIIAGLRARGYTFVTVSKALAVGG